MYYVWACRITWEKEIKMNKKYKSKARPIDDLFYYNREILKWLMKRIKNYQQDFIGKGKN